MDGISIGGSSVTQAWIMIGALATKWSWNLFQSYIANWMEIVEVLISAKLSNLSRSRSHWILLRPGPKVVSNLSSYRRVL